MPTWKKVIVSGSTANLAAVQVDNLTSGQVVIGGGTAGNLSTTAINGTGNIVATTGASGLVHSGSFSGSLLGTATTASYVTGSIFSGGNTALSASYAVTASYAASAAALNNLTQGAGITVFSYNGSSAQTVAVSGASTLNTNGITKWTGNAFATSSLTDNGTVITGTTSIQLSGATSSLTGSFTGSFTGPLTGTASYASTAGQNQGALTLGNGLTGTSYNGSANVTAAVGAGALISVGTGATSVATSSLGANQIPKYSNNTLSGSNISDTGTQVQIAAAATSGLSVAAGGITVSAGGIAVTGNSTFANNVSITGDLSVAGTASFTNTDNLNIKDKFVLINSGSTTLADSGWVTQYNAAGSGSAFYLEAGAAGSTGAYGRFAVAYDILGAGATALTADEYVVTTKLAASNPTNAVSSSWGGTTNSQGNMWVNTSTGDIYIWSGS